MFQYNHLKRAKLSCEMCSHLSVESPAPKAGHHCGTAVTQARRLASGEVLRAVTNSWQVLKESLDLHTTCFPGKVGAY